MKAKWIDEVTEILGGERFSEWMKDLEASRQSAKAMALRHEELLTQVNLLEFRAEVAHRKAIDTLEHATDLEDDSAELANEAAELDNLSFEAVSQFEMQRDRCTRLWEQLGAIDVQLDEGIGNSSRLKRQREKASEEYAREDQKKQRLWREVNDLWLRSIDRGLALKEKQHKAALVRRHAEELFETHENEAVQARVLKEKAEVMAGELVTAETHLSTTQESARQQFGCFLNDDFLYWMAREDNKLIFVSPLIDSPNDYSVPLVAGDLYRCTVEDGVDVLETVSPSEASKAEAGLAVDDSKAEPAEKIEDGETKKGVSKKSSGKTSSKKSSKKSSKS